MRTRNKEPGTRNRERSEIRAFPVPCSLFLVPCFLICLLASSAAADDLEIGLYAPTAPFAGTSARQDYITRLAKHLAASSGAKPIGRVYSRAGDFASAAKGGDLQLAVVDAAYLASIGSPYTVLATATRGGDTSSAWQLITRGGEATIAELKGKTLLCPTIGGKESELVNNALLGGELPKGFFAKIDTSPDVSSALTALGLGRADAAVIPGGLELPSGATRLATLPHVSWPVLVAFGGASAELRAQALDAIGSFDGGDVLGGFDKGGGEAVKALGKKFGKAERRGPMVTPRLEVTVDDIVQARKPAIKKVELLSLIAAPPPLPSAR